MSATAPATVATTASSPKERHSLTLDQRRALRRWANAQTVRPSHKACIEWFQGQYHQTISQSTVSHSLSPKYARLDGDPQLSGSRLRFGNWPDVEKLVLLWHQSMVNSGRQPSNEELAEKAKSIFSELPRYKDEQPPEFSPGWIHRFKKRYGLLIRRQRRHGSTATQGDDIPYLVDTVPRFMNISADTSPAAIRDSVHRIVGVEPSLTTCARVRDEIVHRMVGTPHLTHHHQQHEPPPINGDPLPPPPPAPVEGEVYGDDDPEVVLQNALRAMQQEEAEAEANAAEARAERERADRGLPPLMGLAGQAYAQHAAAGALASTPTPVRASVGPPPPPSAPPSGRYSQADDLTLTPIPANGPLSSHDRPMRCPFCVNQRMLRTIKEAVEHMSSHVVVD